jgi:hypothetical protein
MERIFEHAYFKQFLNDQTSSSRNLRLDLKDNLFFMDFIRTLIENFNKDYAGLWEWDFPEHNEIYLNGKITKIPGFLQSPALELTDEELKLVVYVFEQCLLYLRDYFPGAPISVVYLPSNLSIYDIASENVSIETYHGREQIYPRERVRERSDQIYQMLTEVMDRHHFKYVDARPKLRAAAKNKLIHGPIDWWHLNKEGQYILAEVVLELTEEE